MRFSLTPFLSSSTNFNVLQQQMSQRRPIFPDFIPLTHSWPTNSSKHAPNCTLGASLLLKRTDVRLKYINNNMNSIEIGN